MIELRIAFAAVAAIIGAGFASGRELMTFFSALGGASWVGIALACAGMGFLTAMLCEFSGRSGARSLPELYARVMNAQCGDATHVLFTLLMTITAGAMLAAGAELGALTLPIKYARAVGAAATLAASLAAFKSDSSLGVMGALLAPLMLVYYIWLARYGEVRAVLNPANIPISAALGLLYAALNGALASGAILIAANGRGASPVRVGALVAGIMLAIMIPANLALLGAGESGKLALPSVALAARWGVPGFYISAIALFAGVVTTLAAVLRSLYAQMLSLGVKRRLALTPPAAAAMIISAMGFSAIVDIGYPLLGFACAMTLIALMAFL